MKYTPEQKKEMEVFEPLAMEIVVKCKFLTYSQIRFRLKNLVAAKYNSLESLKFSKIG